MAIFQLPACMKAKNSKRWYAQLIWLGILLLGGGYFIKTGNIVSDVSQFMPQSSSNPELAALLNEVRQGASSRYLLIRLQSTDAAASAALSRDLKVYLQQSPFFSRVQNGEQHYSLDDFKTLYPYRFILTPPPSFTSTALRNSLEKRLSELRSGMGLMLKQTLPSDPQNRFINYLMQVSIQAQPRQHMGVWFDQQQQAAMLLATLSGHAYDLDRQQQAIKLVKDFVAQQSGAQDIQLAMSGPAMMAVATREAIRSTMFYLSCIAGGLMLFLFLWGYRSLKGALLAGLPLLSAVIAALAVTQVVFAQVHGIVIAFGITLLGVCLDFPLHLFSHLNPRQSAPQTLSTIWPTLRLSVITTILSYLALLGTDFAGLSQLAVFAMSGLAAALLVTRWVIPAWITPADINIKIRPITISWRATNSNLLVGAVVGLCLAVLWIESGKVWSKDITELSPIPTASRELDQQLRHEIGAPEVSDAFFVQANDIESLLQQTEALKQDLVKARQQGLVKDIYAISDILPSIRTQTMRQEELPDRQNLQTALETAMQALPFKASAFKPFIDDVEKSRKLEPLVLEDIQQTPLADRLNHDLLQHDDLWLAMIRLSGVSDHPAFMQWLEDQPQLEQHYFNTRQATSALMQEYQQTALMRLGVGLLIMVAVLLITNRSGPVTLRLVAPIVLAVLITISVQVMSGTSLTLFHILSLLLVVGMGLDYSLFFNRRFTDKEDLNRRTHGVMMGAGSTLAAFGVLAFADIPVLAAMGQTVSIGVVSCYVLSQLLARPIQDEQRTC
jgi:predicted exporter